LLITCSSEQIEGIKDSIHAEVALWEYFKIHYGTSPHEIYNWRTIASGEVKFNANPCSRCQQDSKIYESYTSIVYIFNKDLGRWMGKFMDEFETSESSRNRTWNTCCSAQ